MGRVRWRPGSPSTVNRFTDGAQIRLFVMAITGRARGAAWASERPFHSRTGNGLRGGPLSAGRAEILRSRRAFPVVTPTRTCGNVPHDHSFQRHSLPEPVCSMEGLGPHHVIGRTGERPTVK